MYDNQELELTNGKKAYEHIYSKDAPVQAGMMDGHCTFVVDWYPENLPVEDEFGSALPKLVKEMAAEACYQKCPEFVPPEPPAKMDILVFADQSGYCHRLLERVPDGRIGNRKVVTKPASLLTAEDAEVQLAGKSWDLVVMGISLDPPKSNASMDVIEQQSNVVKFIFLFLQTAFKKDGSVKRMVTLTNDIFSEQTDTHIARGLSVTTNGTLYGMMNTARLEVEFPVMLVDIEDLEEPEILPFVASEMFRESTFGVNTVRHCYPWPVKDGIRLDRPFGRYVIRQTVSHEYQKANVQFDIPAEGVIAISGGNGALGLVMGKWLLQQAKKQKEMSAASEVTYVPNFSIQFLSRSMKISDLNMPLWKEVQQLAEELDLANGIKQAAIDMGSQDAVDRYISNIAPNLIGFIHSAGVLQDSMLPNQTWEKFEAVYDSKHRAALYVHDALERFKNPGLKFFWLFSSTSVYGNMGQINYSSSNSYMDALARHRIATGKPCMAVQWGAWGEVGMAATMDDAMRRRVMMGPMPYFSVQQGLEGLEGGLRTGLPGFSVYIVNPPMMFGMIQGDQSKTQCYSRNFYCEYVPTPPPAAFDEGNTYNIYRMYRYISSPYRLDTALVYRQYIMPRLQLTEDSDIVEYSGYGGFT